MAPLALNRAASRVSAPAASPRMGAVRVPRTIVFAQEPRFTLENSKQAAEGFVEKDTAGQSNMYPTIMKPFEAGSAADTVQQDSFNNALAVGSTVLALGAIGLGLTALINTGGSAPAPDVEDYSAYLSLSAYSAKFSEQLAPLKVVSVPVVAEVVVAPPVAAEEVAVAVASPVEVAEAPAP
ncbi:hypothetical protein VOLCADRAFT_120710 [Volvox carteri f. nagariensis]|uniref:Uncharacterized protein n=1 Tax=Volvox carteri f. nagariensis TaxID=3068 RepID=D8TS16_VOLCA|nr:uncharacterized protein VOLCADRAFT_120710 [Volvox carteri f. nagariensis]EFJ49614.1 hypothetical protein VOLCADRAFT_120710 [Volvox carteri f. nagariensis]|eukprot:XP_002949121.1 hypothetical protein VOLCADRAFT_120710 [Volvox carteri f. nagariensis]